VIAIRALVEALQSSIVEWKVRVNPKRYLGHFRAGDAFPEFLVLWALFPMVFFSFSQSKLPGYILPSIPPLTVLTGDYLNRVRKVGLPKWLLWSHAGMCALVIFVLMLAPQHMLYNTLVPPVSWLLSAGAAALLVFFRGGVDHPHRGHWACAQRDAWAGVRGAGLSAGLSWKGPRPELLSAAAGARDATAGADVRQVAVEDVRRDMVYGLGFYRNQQPVDYRDGAEVPAGEHLLVIPSSESAQLQRWLAGRVYEPLFLYPSQGLEVYRVYASSEVGRGMQRANTEILATPE